MPRAQDTKALIVRLLDELMTEARRQGEADAMEKLQSLLTGGKRGPGRPRGSKNASKTAAGSKSKRKNSWSGLSHEARLARVNAIRKGRGLPPKDKL